MYRIFIVEDDPGIAEGIKRQAEAWGLEVRWQTICAMLWASLQPFRRTLCCWT